MRIISGRFRGQSIEAPKGKATRPTSDRVREAIMSALDARFLIKDALVLDVFAGSGALSFEMLSRGACFAILNDTDFKSRASLKKNVANLGLKKSTRLHAFDAFHSSFIDKIRPEKPLDMILMDPPYQFAPQLPQLLEAFAKDKSTLPQTHYLIECDKSNPPTIPHHFEIVFEMKHGDTLVLLLNYMVTTHT